MAGTPPNAPVAVCVRTALPLLQTVPAPAPLSVCPPVQGVGFNEDLNSCQVAQANLQTQLAVCTDGVSGAPCPPPRPPRPPTKLVARLGLPRP